MQVDDARELLGFSSDSHPTPSQISEAYSCLQAGTRLERSDHATYARVVRTGVPRVYGGRSNRALVMAPFFLLIFGTVALGGLNASRAYKRQKEAYPSHNPFLP
ncbi:uncharacterized protein LOC131224790 isoform X4 [Magnolia sinica]|uniref:uncharacterized protein LOC131224790 isoform X4 n=1 Tax=Magnolia sinica TaxID=86752 RepID=UPI002659F559|nr:uncharacterized protein LOC131224790 isoform X4 [Magnolia sinica]XP_058076158.1 uncharacterized protein LOC131224790 isoform X4 [Magnolia sinica]